MSNSSVSLVASGPIEQCTDIRQPETPPVPPTKKTIAPPPPQPKKPPIPPTETHATVCSESTRSPSSKPSAEPPAAVGSDDTKDTRNALSSQSAAGDAEHAPKDLTKPQLPVPANPHSSAARTAVITPIAPAVAAPSPDPFLTTPRAEPRDISDGPTIISDSSKPESVSVDEHSVESPPPPPPAALSALQHPQGAEPMVSAGTLPLPKEEHLVRSPPTREQFIPDARYVASDPVTSEEPAQSFGNADRVWVVEPINQLSSAWSLTSRALRQQRQHVAAAVSLYEMAHFENERIRERLHNFQAEQTAEWGATPSKTSRYTVR